MRLKLSSSNPSSPQNLQAKVRGWGCQLCMGSSSNLMVTFGHTVKSVTELVSRFTCPTWTKVRLHQNENCRPTNFLERRRYFSLKTKRCCANLRGTCSSRVVTKFWKPRRVW